MDKKTINDIAEILEDIKKDPITEAQGKGKEIDIDELIDRLKDAKKNGHNKIRVDGWLWAEKGNRSDMIFTNSRFG